MSLYLIRHAKAGDRRGWPGHDDERPISKRGRAQALALADRLEGEDVSALISSPSLRCVQSVEPLADRLGMKVETDDRLAEGASVPDSLRAVSEAPDGAVLCSHGDVIPDVIDTLVRRGMELTTAPDWRKATLWVLDRDGHRSPGDEPVFIRARVEPPPKV